MTVRKIFVDDRIFDVTGTGFETVGKFFLDGKETDPKKISELKLLLQISKMCNGAAIVQKDGINFVGDPTEIALKILAAKAGIMEDYKRTDEIPFSSQRKMMTTVFAAEKFSFTKGAPEIVLARCKTYADKQLTDASRQKILKVVEAFASKGLRVLGFAYKKVGANYSKQDLEKDMTFVGLAGMLDPPRKETKSAIALTKQAGTRTIMITGDHRLTAEVIAHEVGLEGNAITGEELDKLTEEQFAKVVDEVSIFARITPQHKTKIVEYLEKKGEVVAVTGDGVNDAPALKRADIGVAMGIKGTDVAKEAADIILLDDNFSTIVSAVEEGRLIFENIKKFVKYLLSANLGEVFLIGVAVAIGLSLPLLPLQLLWLNILTDGLPALALSVDPKEKDIMQRKPRGKESILKNAYVFLAAAGFISLVATLSVFLLNVENIAKARTMVFTTLVLFELFFVFNCRSETKSVFRLNPLANKKLILAVIFSVILQLLVVYLPFLQTVFDTTALSINDWLYVLGFSALGLFVLPEIFIRRKD